MSNTPATLKYSRTHEWIDIIDKNTARIGVTDHAQDLLGDIVFVEAPDVGTTVTAKDACAVVESVKAASDIYSPLTGEIIEINDALSETPEHINQDAYGKGWIFCIRFNDQNELDSLLDADAYDEFANAEDH